MSALAEALPATLAWQKDMLLYVAKKAIMGCDARVWQAAAPTATALATALCGESLKMSLYCQAVGVMPLLSKYSAVRLSN